MNNHTLRSFCGCIGVLLLTVHSFHAQFRLGIENIPAHVLKKLQKKDGKTCRVGVITNQTGRDQIGNRVVDILRTQGIHIAYILAPEHGFEGSVAAGKQVIDGIDQATSIPIKSIYGHGGDLTISGKRINPDVMRQIDALVYDIQDSGMRHYSYISTLMCALEAAAEHQVLLVVLDRPNFLGAHMEGPLVEPYPQLKSFISIAPIPLRHGMTAGELARYFNKFLIAKPAELVIVTMKDYERDMMVPFLSPLSPNITSLQSLYGYSFLGILGEVEPFYVGVGTPEAFQVIMVPDTCHSSSTLWLKAKILLSHYGISSTSYSIIRKNKSYTGLKLHIADGKQVASFSLLLKLLSLFKESGISFVHSSTFDKAVGTPKVKSFLHGECSEIQLHEKVKAGLEAFFRKAQAVYLYKPLPVIKQLV